MRRPGDFVSVAPDMPGRYIAANRRDEVRFASCSRRFRNRQDTLRGPGALHI
jgi:hypothetical protein